MSNKHLHIVTLDTPWPVSYGGVVDLFYKLKALHNLGVKIHLHCFCKDDAAKHELNKYCVEVNYYKRTNAFSFNIPYIVKSRSSEQLLQNINNDNYPVLLEGIHCTYHLYKNKLLNRKVFVRLHNVEFEYYMHLAKNESNLLKRLYYLHESKLLKRYEAVIANKATIIAVSKHDVTIYKTQFNAEQINFLAVFIEDNSIQSFAENGSYCLYHGNLSINENVEAVHWLLQHVFHNLKIPFVVAGKNPAKKLVHKVHKYGYACIVENPNDKDLDDLICKAQINILPSFNNTGVKLKLINALRKGKHCITNTAGVEGSGLESTCHIANTKEEMQQKIKSLFTTTLTQEEIVKRQHLLTSLYNNQENAKKLVEIIFN